LTANISRRSSNSVNSRFEKRFLRERLRDLFVAMAVPSYLMSLGFRANDRRFAQEGYAQTGGEAFFFFAGCKSDCRERQKVNPAKGF
jgi:hypothetical protein